MAGRIAYYGNIVRDGLVLLLDAAKKDSYPGSGTLWRDISGNGNNGTLTNGPTFNSNNGGSIVFDGTNDFVSGPTTLTKIDNWSLSCWVLPTNVTPLQTIFINYTYAIQILNGIIRYHYPNVFGTGVSTSVSITSGIWTHIVLLRENGVLKCYKNGVLGNGNITSANPFSGGPTGTFTLGFYTTNEPYRYTGNISYAQAYNRALTPTEVLQNFNATRGRYGI